MYIKAILENQQLLAGAPGFKSNVCYMLHEICCNPLE